jgi:hypothetical protein
MSQATLSALEIKVKIIENFVEYAKIFTPFQSSFLCGLNQRYQCLDSGSLILNFARNTHQAILRKKDYDLNYDLSFENFWKNHKSVNQPRSTIMTIAQYANLPKETTRRKLLELTKQKILNKKNNYISWHPSEEYKLRYNIFVVEEIKNMAKLTKYITNLMKMNFSKEDIENEYKNKFSFYWYHYLDLQIKWMRLWKLRFKDLDIPLIFLQFAILLTSKLDQGKNISTSKLWSEPNIIKDQFHKGVSVSATSISDITGIPRATCIRKLNIMVAKKMVLRDKNTKRYYLIPEALNKNLVSKELVEKVSEIFSEFYFISLKALSTKTLY